VAEGGSSFGCPSFHDVRGVHGSYRELAVETYENDMLGLLSSKNYKFTLSGESPEEVFWKRYERLYRRAHAGQTDAPEAN